MGNEKQEGGKLASLLEGMKKTGLPVQTGGYEIEAIPTGIASFDHSTGIGGFPRKRVSLIQGEEASGKTMLLLLLIASAQAAGEKCAFVDLEHALTPDFTRLFGVDYESLVISRPETLNQAYDVAKELVMSKFFGVVGFDSAVALATDADIERSAREGAQRAGQAGVHSEELKKMVSVLQNTPTAFIIINQLREDPNPPSWWKSGKKLYSPGGRALRHHSSLSVEMRKKQTYKEAGEKVGHEVETYIFKNKVAQPFQKARFDLFYSSGIDADVNLVDAGLQLGIIEQHGSWFSMEVPDPETGEIVELKRLGRAAFDEMVKDDEDGARRILSVAVRNAKVKHGDFGSDEDEDDGDWSEI